MTRKLICEDPEQRDKKVVSSIKTASFFRIPVIFAVIFFFLYPIRPACAIELSADEQAYLSSKETIVFVSQTRYPPFEFVDKNNEHTGMCIELARWMATEFGFTTKFTDTYFKQAQQDVLSGKADVLTSFFYSKKRDEAFDFTQIMFEVPASIFVVVERTDIKDIQDLNGKHIAMQTGDYAKEFLESKKVEFDIVHAKNFAEATDLVIAGKADAIVGDEQIVFYHIFKNKLTKKIKKVGEPLYIGQSCMATREANPMLLSILNKGMKLAQENGVLEKINRKWIGTHYTLHEPLLHKYCLHIFLFAGTLFLFVLLFWLWNDRLQRAVRERMDKLHKAHEELEMKVEERTSKLSKLTEDLENQIEARIGKEIALRESEEKARALLNASKIGIVLSDNKGMVLDTNEEYANRFSMHAQDMVGMTIWDLFPPEVADIRKANIRQVFESGIPFNMVDERQGMWNDIFIHPIFDISGNVIRVAIFAQDITEQRKLQDQLIRSERFAATGQLAATVAHEINSPLQAVTTMLGVLNKEYADDKELSDSFDLLYGAFQSIRDTVKNLMDLNRPGKDVKQHTNVNNIIIKTVDLLKSYLKKNKVTVNLDLSSKVQENLASPQQLNHVFLNLISNAIEAMTGTTGAKCETTIRKINIKTNLKIGNIIIKVADTGPGISDKDFDHIFDPFYTRKKQMGMGVGLSVCHGIIEDHNGTITARNLPDGGAVFTITLPVL
ncbi:MAG: transporter substrate-binding domain-containing protein [Deltaproteobacteria bacterium]|nr:transporter substrate-binding domain-containing protein [Deltaproteobacteria bacterium]